ncbi:hypothetical protein DFH09DRAFT_1091643 [Mycena vulgaris]|nr:hypothetical protein DFH09DRAFT_1091643 [Mycena vulgaris]
MPDVKWVYDTVEELEASQPMDLAVFGDFLQVLVYFRHVPRGVKPATAIFRGILFILNNARDTYNPDLVHQMTAHHIALGAELSQTSEWQSIITEDLPGWLATLPTLLVESTPETESTRKFCAVLCRLWEAEAAEITDSVKFTGAARAKEATTLHLATDLKDMVIGATELMLKLASTINGDLKNERSQGDTDTQGDEFQYWTGLKNTFEKDLHESATVLRNGTGHGSGFSDFNVESSK